MARRARRHQAFQPQLGRGPHHVRTVQPRHRSEAADVLTRASVRIGWSMPDTDAIDFSRLAPVAGSRIAIVGGCGGIGRELVSACHALQLRTAVLDLPGTLSRHPPPAEDVIRVPVDVSSEQAVIKGFGEVDRYWGGLDVLVFVTGIAVVPPRSIEELTSSQWDEVLQVNLRAAWFCVREALPLMKKAGGGSIVTIASSLAYNPNRGFSAYVASKGGLV